MPSISQAGFEDQLIDRDPQLVSELMLIIRRTAAHFSWTAPSALDDICQDCYLRLAENFRKGQFRQESSLKTYVYAVVRNTCIDHYRADRAAEMVDINEVEITDSGLSPDAALITRENRRTAFLVLQSLSRECRQLWRTIFFGKLNYNQAAQKLGMAEGTVKRKMWECRQMAKRLVNKYER